jgi:hypothetical protein
VSEYTGRAWREGDWWVIDVQGVGVTQARTLDKVDHMARSLVADMTGAGYETVTVSVAVDLPPEVAAQVEALRRKSEQAADLAREAADLQTRLVESLATGERLTGRAPSGLGRPRQTDVRHFPQLPITQCDDFVGVPETAVPGSQTPSPTPRGIGHYWTRERHLSPCEPACEGL